MSFVLKLVSVCALILSSATVIDAAPAHVHHFPISFPPVDEHGLLCKLPFVNKILCPRQGSGNGFEVDTPLGKALGTVDPSSATVRIPVRYASADRWKESSVVKSWSLPNGGSDVTALPLACPQNGVDATTYTEDCLSMVLYIPTTLARNSNAPIFVWVHGGSFVSGSATGAGLDGSKLAKATNSIVAVVQYRLGALGFVAPDGKANLGLGDLINALKFLGTVASNLGGDKNKITLAGQSSGANMIRALLAAPSADSLFRSAILQSDPMNYGFLSTSVQSKLVNSFNSKIGCGASDTSCQRGLSLNTILSAQNDLMGDAMDIDESTGIAQPIRIVRDGSLVASPLDSTGSFPSVSKAVLLTTVVNEAGPSIYSPATFPNPLESFMFSAVSQANLGEERADTVVNSGFYNVSQLSDGSVDARVQLEELGTDYIWKCSGWTFARNWVQHGGKAYVGTFTVGKTYPANQGLSYCSGGKVCHQDDIEIVFGTVENPTSAQSALTSEIQARYAAFMSSGSNPNAANFPNWAQATTTDVKALNLGGSSTVKVGACAPEFWGSAVEYDYQVFGI